MRLFDDDSNVYAWNRRRPRQNGLHRPQRKPFFRALRDEVAFRVDGSDEWFPALVKSLDQTLFVPNSRSGVQRRSLRRGLGGVALYPEPHGTNPWEEVKS